MISSWASSSSTQSKFSFTSSATATSPDEKTFGTPGGTPKSWTASPTPAERATAKAAILNFMSFVLLGYPQVPSPQAISPQVLPLSPESDESEPPPPPPHEGVKRSARRKKSARSASFFGIFEVGEYLDHANSASASPLGDQSVRPRSSKEAESFLLGAKSAEARLVRHQRWTLDEVDAVRDRGEDGVEAFADRLGLAR